MRQSLASPRTSSEAPRLLNQVRDKIRLKHYSIRTEQAHTDWVKRFSLLHKRDEAYGGLAAVAAAGISPESLYRSLTRMVENSSFLALLIQIAETSNCTVVIWNSNHH